MSSLLMDAKSLGLAAGVSVFFSLRVQLLLRVCPHNPHLRVYLTRDLSSHLPFYQSRPMFGIRLDSKATR